MRGEFDPRRRIGLFREFNHVFHDEVPWLLLIHSEVGVLINRRIRGVKVRPTGIRDFSLWIDERVP